MVANEWRWTELTNCAELYWRMVQNCNWWIVQNCTDEWCRTVTDELCRTVADERCRTELTNGAEQYRRMVQLYWWIVQNCVDEWSSCTDERCTTVLLPLEPSSLELTQLELRSSYDCMIVGLNHSKQLWLSIAMIEKHSTQLAITTYWN